MTTCNFTRRGRCWAGMLALAALAACGGGGEDEEMAAEPMMALEAVAQADTEGVDAAPREPYSGPRERSYRPPAHDSR